MPPTEPTDLPIDDTPPAELVRFGVAETASFAPSPRLTETTPVATVERALAFWESQLGLAEYPPGSNVNWITDWYFGWHAAWCAMTVSRALIEAGFGGAEQIDIPLSTTSRLGWAYCPYVEDDFKAAGRWHDADPEPGDLVLYDWDDDGWADHIGMLKEAADDGSLYVYEGNTDEGVLRLKHRSLTYVRGFARPPYTVAAPAPEPTPAPAPQEVHDVFIFDAPASRGGGIYFTDAATWKRGVPNGDALLPYRLGLVPHLGEVTEAHFDSIPHWTGTAMATVAEAEALEAEALAGPLVRYAGE